MTTTPNQPPIPPAGGTAFQEGAGQPTVSQAAAESARDAAICAAERDLQAAREALLAAEQRLAEAQAAVTGSGGPGYGQAPCQQSAGSAQTAATVSGGPGNSQVAYQAPATPQGSFAQAPGQQSLPNQPQGSPAQAAYQQAAPGQTQQGYAQQAPGSAQGAYARQTPGSAQGSYAQSSPASAQGEGAYAQSSPNPAQGAYRQPPMQPHYAAPLSSRDHVAAGLLAIFLGGFGVHKFYLGYNTQGFIMLALSLLGGLFTFGLVTGVVWIIAIIEGIVYLAKTQSEFEQLYVCGRHEWF